MTRGSTLLGRRDESVGRPALRDRRWRHVERSAGGEHKLEQVSGLLEDLSVGRVSRCLGIRLGVLDHFAQHAHAFVVQNRRVR